MKPFGPAYLVAMCTIAVPTVISAQSYETGGIQLTFGAALGLEATDNSDFMATETQTRIAPYAGLTFGLLSATPASSFGIDASAEVRESVSDDSIKIATPRLSTRYDRSSANATLNLSASAQITDLSQENGGIVDASGLSGSITGTATRRATTASASLIWGQTSRVTYGFGTSYVDNTYTGGTATGLDGTALDDNRRLTLDGMVTFDLTKATELKTSLSYSVFEATDTADQSETVILNTGISIDRPLGAVTADFAIADLDAGQQYSLSFGRSLALPAGVASGTIGVTSDSENQIALTATVSARRDLPNGSLSLDISRQVSSLNEQDTSQLTTQISTDYSQALTSLTTLQVGLDLVQTEDVASNKTSQSTGLEASVSQTLTEDWAADAGYRYRSVDDTPGDTAQSNTIFVELRRVFVTRY